MTDFFAAALYAFAFEKIYLDLFSLAISQEEIFAKTKFKVWYEKNKPLISALTVGTLLAIYERSQTFLPGRSFDIKDMVAYLAGLGLYLSSERIFQEYLVLKDKFKGKMLPFLAEREAGIKDGYEKGMIKVNRSIKNIPLVQR